MTFSRVFQLALNYLKGHARRYLFLFIALSFGFSIITWTTALSEGMNVSVTNAARSHYAGDVFIMGIDADHRRFHLAASEDLKYIDKAVQEAGLDNAVKIKRTNTQDGAVLYFNGNASRQKYLYGIDWETELNTLKNLNYSEGGVDTLPGENSILISKPIADYLGAENGDRITLQVHTLTGQINTGTFITAGIFNDPSIFGYYKCFVDRKTLNSMLKLKPAEYSALGLILPRGISQEKASQRLYSSLSKYLDTYPAIYNKDKFKKESSAKWKGIRYFIVPLKMYISEVDDLLTAMNIISYTVFAVIILIVLVSVNVTYKLVINERLKEIASLRAIGMKKRTIRSILLTEALYLFIISITGGIVLSGLLLFITGRINFDWIPGFEIFTSGGRLRGVIDIKTLGTNALLLFIIVLPSAVVPVFKVSQVPLNKALSGKN